MNGQKPSRRSSEYGQQLKSKQKIKNIYRLLEKQFKNYVKAAVESKKEPYGLILNALEHRLDNVVFRMGLGQSRDQARQLVNHGHILVNGRKVNIPSYTVKIGDIISVREGSKKSPFFMNLVPQWLPAYEPPAWLSVDKQAMTATVKGQTTPEESGVGTGDIQAIIEFYSR